MIATPIGNLEDLTRRAVRLLGSVDRILCEDTRRTRALLEALDLPTPPRGLVRCDAHAEGERLDEVLGWLATGESIALVSDAGTPGLSDPGERLVRAAWGAGHVVVPVPGPSAVTAALSVSGLGASGFTFGGFVDKGSEAARRQLADLPPGVFVFFCPARDLLELAAEASLIPTIAEMVIARELTKLHETFYRGAPRDVHERLQGDPEAALGEAVVVFDVRAAVIDDEAIVQALQGALVRGGSKKDAIDAVAGALGVPRRRVYQLALGIRDAKG
ncbi:MAG: rRNA small subunit methyltransferase 1 [Deltaproteobacteria bacterium]|nr:rRNA small subunit methyltransferase 1 [Deltaproteobacteria bacterium]